jgi:hypothetical protein
MIRREVGQVPTEFFSAFLGIFSCHDLPARATRLYESHSTRDSRALMKTKIARLKHSWQPKTGWGVPLAWLTLCVFWSSTWLAIKVGLRDLPPNCLWRFVLIAIAV